MFLRILELVVQAKANLLQAHPNEAAWIQCCTKAL